MAAVGDIGDVERPRPGAPAPGGAKPLAADLGRGLFEGRGGAPVATASEAIVMIDDRQVIVALNAAAQAMLRCPFDEALGQSLDRFVPAADRAAHAGHVRDFAQSGVVERAMAARRHVNALRADGEAFPVEITISRVELRSDDGPRRCFAALLRDRSGDSAFADEIDQLRHRLRAIFELAPSAIWIVDDERVVFANATARRILQMQPSAEDPQGPSIFSLLHPRSHAPLRREMARAFGEPAAIHRVQASLATGSQPSREVEVVLAALPHHDRTTLQMVVADVTQSRAEAFEIEGQRHALRQLSARLVEAREEERRRIARELHDELGQRLTALKMDLCTLAHGTGLEVADARVAGMLGMLDETLASVRRIAGDLRPLMLDDLGLNAAIEWLANEASRRLGIPIELALDDIDPAIDERCAIALYRMVQEALTNVARHARAARIGIELRLLAGELRLVVEDDGVGLPPQALRGEGAYGLMGMRERAQMLGGRVDIESPSSGGARLTVHIPLAAAGRPAGSDAGAPA